MPPATEKSDQPVTYADLKEDREELAGTFKREFAEYQERARKERKQYGEELADTKEVLDRLNDRMDEIEARWQDKLRQYEEEQGESPTEKRSRVYKKFLRKGERALEAEEFQVLETPTDSKLLATDTDPDGGYLVPRNVSDEIIRFRRATSPIRQFARVRTISQGDSFDEPVESDVDWDSGWAGERNTSASHDTGTWDYVKIPTHELDAQPRATRKMIEDPAFDIEQWVTEKVQDRFSRVEATAFVNGDGQNKPKGILADDRITPIASGLAGDITFQGLLNLVYDIEEEEWVRGARLFFNRKTLAVIRGITDDNNRPIYDVGDPQEGPTVEGQPFTTGTDFPTVETGAKSILYGDLSQSYTIVDRLDIWFQRDPYTVKPKVEFYYRTRVGGQVVRPEALRVMTID